MAKFKLKADRLGRKAGTVVYDYLGCDYGLCDDDERFGNQGPCRAVTLGSDGVATPFFTVPVCDLEPAP